MLERINYCQEALKLTKATKDTHIMHVQIKSSDIQKSVTGQ